MTNYVQVSGSFTSDGNDVTLSFPQGAQWIRVYNLTQLAAAQVAALGVEYYWQDDMVNDSQIAYLKSNAANAANLMVYSTAGGFRYQNTTNLLPGVTNATITGIDNANPPVVTAAAHGLVDGDIVRILNVTGAQQLGGLDFTVNVTAANTFELLFMAQIVATGAVVGGTWSKVNNRSYFYPSRRYITAISQAAQAVITLSVTPGYVAGQLVRLVVPDAYGMTEADGILATILSVDAANGQITVDVDSTAFTAFAFPVSADVPFSPAMVVPVGEDTASAITLGADILSDATVNQGSYDLVLKGGAGYPGGANNDVMMWIAGSPSN